MPFQGDAWGLRRAPPLRPRGDSCENARAEAYAHVSAWAPRDDTRPSGSYNFTLGGPPNLHDGWLGMELTLKTSANSATPKLQDVRVGYKCPE